MYCVLVVQINRFSCCNNIFCLLNFSPNKPQPGRAALKWVYCLYMFVRNLIWVLTKASVQVYYYSYYFLHTQIEVIAERYYFVLLQKLWCSRGHCYRIGLKQYNNMMSSPMPLMSWVSCINPSETTHQQVNVLPMCQPDV